MTRNSHSHTYNPHTPTHTQMRDNHTYINACIYARANTPAYGAQNFYLLNRFCLLLQPTVGVDPELRARIWAYLKDISRTGVTIVITTHYVRLLFFFVAFFFSFDSIHCYSLTKTPLNRVTAANTPCVCLSLMRKCGLFIELSDFFNHEIMCLYNCFSFYICRIICLIILFTNAPPFRSRKRFRAIELV